MQIAGIDHVVLTVRDLGVVLSAQPGFLPPYLADWQQGLDEQRVDRLMPIGTAMALGIPVILGSDMPSGPAGPLAAITAAVRRDAGSRIVGATEGIGLDHAWRAHTSVPAEVMGEPRLGILEPGRRADLVILDGDPFAADDPGAAGIVATMVDGHMVHDETGRYT